MNRWDIRRGSERASKWNNWLSSHFTRTDKFRCAELRSPQRLRQQLALFGDAVGQTVFGAVHQSADAAGRHLYSRTSFERPLSAIVRVRLGNSAFAAAGLAVPGLCAGVEGEPRRARLYADRSETIRSNAGISWPSLLPAADPM